MDTTGKYVIDSNAILEKAYELLCIFFANKEIARRSDPGPIAYGLRSLEERFFESKTTTLLIELAAKLRVLDDQMRNLPKDDIKKEAYNDRRSIVDKFDFALFDDLNLSFRDVCNKIIHSDVFEPHSSPGHETHEMDHEYRYGATDKPSIDWHHLNVNIRLSGKISKKEWYVLLDIEVFVNGIYTLLVEFPQ